MDKRIHERTGQGYGIRGIKDDFPLCMGHSSLISKFLNFFSRGQCPSVWLFSGLPGVGKSTLCQVLSTFVALDFAGQGPEAMEDEAFLKCFHLVRQRQHPLIFSFDAKDSDITQRIRETRISLLTTCTAWRTVIVTNVDALNSFASGALLKILEAPPPCVLFLLTTDCPENVLPTVFSRCFHGPLLPLTLKEMTQYLAPSSGVVSGGSSESGFCHETGGAQSSGVVSGGSSKPSMEELYFWTMGCPGRIKEYTEVSKSLARTPVEKVSSKNRAKSVDKGGGGATAVSLEYGGSLLWELLTETRKMLNKTLQAGGLNMGESQSAGAQGGSVKGYPSAGPILEESLLQKLGENCHGFGEWVFLWLYDLALKNPARAPMVYEVMGVIFSKFQAHSTYHMDPLFFVQDIFVTMATALSPFHWEGIHVL